MTNIDIINMAREAGLHRQQHNLMSNPVQYRFSYDGYEENLEAFAALVAQRVLAGNYPEMIALVAAAAKAEEREACAKVCAEDASGRDSGGYYAEIIRNRSNT